ncbi:MAG TPA: hypothetical protein VFW30_02750, partial [Bryocella sp.]|nr:hypothetical protein [Bryocella sp.]
MLLAAWCLLALSASPAAVTHQAAPQHETRVQENFDFDWRFSRGDIGGAEAPGFADGSWRSLDLPHDWSIEGSYDQENPGFAVSAWLPTGIGWYRKSFDVTPEMLQKDVTILFDGVFMDSTTWINGTKLGTEPYGYMSFHYDLSKYLHPGRNTIAVRVNNLLQPAARWYTGSGIYGHVTLLETPQTHIPLWSTFVRTVSATGDHADIAVSTGVEGGQQTGLSVRFTVIDAAGRSVATQSLPAGRAIPDLEHPVRISIANARLWSPDTPALYTLRTQLMHGKALVDSEDTTFGIRTTAFDPARGFLINGQVLKL